MAMPGVQDVRRQLVRPLHVAGFSHPAHKIVQIGCQRAPAERIEPAQVGPHFQIGGAEIGERFHDPRRLLL